MTPRPTALEIIINMREKNFREELILEEVEKELKRLSQTPSTSSNEEWISVKPVFKSDCWLLTATKYKDNWELNLWQIQWSKGFDEHGNDAWYWGIFDDGDEWGDLADLKADLYKIITDPSAPSVKDEKGNDKGWVALFKDEQNYIDFLRWQKGNDNWQKRFDELYKITEYIGRNAGKITEHTWKVYKEQILAHVEDAEQLKQNINQ